MTTLTMHAPATVEAHTLDVPTITTEDLLAAALREARTDAAPQAWRANGMVD